MLNIVLFSLLVLNSGIYPQDIPKTIDNITPEGTNDNPTVRLANGIPDSAVSSTSNPDEYVTSKPATPQTATKQQVPGLSLTPEQIDKLADKILMAHGVEPSPQTPQDYKKVERLKNVVAKVESNLENKLKETAQQVNEDKLKNEDENQSTIKVIQEEDGNINNENIGIKENIQDKPNDKEIDAEGNVLNENMKTSNDAGETKNEVVNEEDAKEIDGEIDVLTDGGDNDEDKLDINIANETEGEKIQESQQVIEEIKEKEVQLEGQGANINEKEAEEVIEEEQITVEAKIETNSEEDKTEYVVEDKIRDESKEDDAQETDNTDAATESSFEEAKIKEENEEEVDESDLETCNAEKNDCDQGNNKYLYSADDNLNHELETKVENGYFDKILNFIYDRF